MSATNSGISSEEKRLTGLHQNQNFGQAVARFHLILNLVNHFVISYKPAQCPTCLKASIQLKRAEGSREKVENSKFYKEQMTSDREELIAKKENLLVQDYRSRLPVESFLSSTKERFRCLRRKHCEHITCHERTNNIHS